MGQGQCRGFWVWTSRMKQCRRAGWGIMLVTHRERAECTELSLAGKRGRLANPDDPTGRAAYGGVVHQSAADVHGARCPCVRTWPERSAAAVKVDVSECQFSGISLGQNISKADGRHLRTTGLPDASASAGQRGGMAAHWSVSWGEHCFDRWSVDGNVSEACDCSKPIPLTSIPWDSGYRTSGGGGWPCS